MFRSPRLFPALLVLVLLSASPALSQSRGAVPPSPISWSEALRSLLPDFVTRLWGHGGGLGGRQDGPAAGATSYTSIWADLGCDIDPYGRCRTTPQLTGGH
jgi:hypothetical protein